MFRIRIETNADPNTGKKDAVTLLNRIRKKEYGSELKNAMGLRTHGFIP
jgi:hypothetical protein